MRDSAIQFGDYLFTEKVGKIFDKQTGKSAHYENLLEVRKFSLIEASDNSVLLSRDSSNRNNKLKITVIDWQNKNKVLWQIDFSNLDIKPVLNPKTTAE